MSGQMSRIEDEDKEREIYRTRGQGLQKKRMVTYVARREVIHEEN